MYVISMDSYILLIYYTQSNIKYFKATRISNMGVQIARENA